MLGNGQVTITESVVEDNFTQGLDSDGGAILNLGAVTITDSTINGNQTRGDRANGGAVVATFGVTLTNSVVSNNNTIGDNSSGGGIFADSIELARSTVAGNSTEGTDSSGGGLYSSGPLFGIDSTIDGNFTRGNESPGGGVSAGGVTLFQSTVSGNFTVGSGSNGGGIATYGGAITRSTVTQNEVRSFGATGGGLANLSFSTLEISSSILSGNFAEGAGATDDLDLGDGFAEVLFSLIGTGVSPNLGGIANQISDDPGLASLANNGGPTRTHALLPDSPAIDNGEGLGFFSDTGYDQRGEPFVRVFDAANAAGSGVDIGAFEFQPALGDFDLDGDVDLADLDRYFGNIGAAATGELALLDLDADGVVGQNDFVRHYSELVETSNGQRGTFAGDANLDGQVDVLGDAFALIGNLNQSVSSWAQGDFNADGQVDVLGDAFLLIGNFGRNNLESFIIPLDTDANTSELAFSAAVSLVEVEEADLMVSVSSQGTASTRATTFGGGFQMAQTHWNELEDELEKNRRPRLAQMANPIQPEWLA